jgi:class 3 adenylate cyclase
MRHQLTLCANTTAQLPASPSPATLPLASEADVPGQNAEAEAGTKQRSFAVGTQVRVHDLPGHLERFNGKLGNIESVEADAQGSQWLNVKLDDSVRVLPIRCPSTAATFVPYEEHHDGLHVRESVQQGVRMEEHGGQLLPGEAVTVSDLPMNLARYDGCAGHVVSFDHDSDEPRVWVKLEDDVRELPIRCPVSCVKRTKTSFLHAALFDQPLKKQFMSDGEQIKVGKKSAGNLEDYAHVMAHFKAEKLETIVEEDEKDMEEERNTNGQEDDGEEKWDPTKQELWAKKMLTRRNDLILVSNLVRSLGQFRTANVEVEEKKMTAAERVELEKEKMALEKQRLKEEEKAKRMAGPQPLIPGIVSNPDEFAFTFTMIIITVFSLWGIDLYNMLINNPLENDLAFHTTVLVCFIFFALEFILYTAFKPGYVGSFFFYLDLMATISLLPDFLLLWGMEVFGDTGDSGGGDDDASGFARAGRAARAGTRAARIVRVFKAITLIKKSRQQGMKPPSLVGQLVNDGIQRKIIIIVAIMLVASELLTMILDEKDFKETSTSFQHMLFNAQTLLTIAGGNVKTEPFVSSIVSIINDYNCRSYSDQKVACPSHCIIDKNSLGAMEETIDCDIRYLRVNGKDVYGYGPSERAWKFDLRSTPAQRSIIGVEGKKRCQGEQNWNASVLVEGGTEYERWVPDIGAWRSGFGAYRSSNPDLRNRSCLAYPCEDEQLADPCSMLILRTTLDTRKSSLASALTVVFVTILLGWSSSNFGTLTSRLVIVPLESMTAMVRGLMADPMAKLSVEEAGVSDGETKAIAGALIKLSTMLQIAFGEAGSDIITTNLNSGTEVNALIPGKRLQGVYGFCDIRSFTDCTECLQEDVMVFVNRIADAVHRSVSLNEGAPNKNVGDAFQLAWRLPERRIVGQPVTVADSALRAILRILFETSTCPALYRLTSNTALQMRIPNYTTRFGFGLHAGWGIEGAIGSSLKIDPTYLSPNVKWSERLETATKVYGVLILMSDAFFDLLTPLVQKLCRKIDKIKVPDSKTPLDLYTYDTYAFDLNDTEMRFLSPFGNTFWEAFPPVTTDAWRRQFERALIPYSKGNWQEAKVLMQACLEIVPDDKPGLHIMKVMEEHKFHAPPSWKGYRDAEDV